MKVSFKDLPVFFKQLIAISLVIIVASFTIVHVQSFDTDIKNYAGKDFVANKLLFYSQQIVLHSELVLREKVKAKADLEKDINLFEKYYYTLKNGGEIVGDESFNEIMPPSDDEVEMLQDIESLWFAYKESARMILEEETFKGGMEMASGYKDDQGNYVEEEVFKSVKNEIRTAIENIEKDSQTIGLKLSELSDQITSKSVQVLEHKTEIGQRYFMLMMFVVVLCLIVFYFYISKRIGKFRDAFSLVVKGYSDVTIDEDGKDEVGEMRQFLRQMIERLNYIVVFVDAVAKGELKQEFQSENENDRLANSLNLLKNTLSSAKEEELRRQEEDQIRNWTTHGIAKFGEILRMNSENLKELSYNIVSNLIDYVGAIQGGIFLIEQKGDTKVLKLLVSYAFDREKYMKKELAWGESLVGRCALERKTIYLKEVPEDYLEITSGLGNAKPASILLTPLTFNNEIFGVLEIASFEEIEDHKIEFVEKVSTSIGSTIANVRTNLQTSSLLAESKEQAERLAQQEEEMRQNMEEMQATQEEATQKTLWLENIIKSVQSLGLYYELDGFFKVEYANDKFVEICSLDYPIGNDHWDIVKESFQDRAEYKGFMDEILSGNLSTREVVYESPAGKRWFAEQYSPVLNIHDEVEKIIVVGSEVSEIKNKAAEMETLLAELAKRDDELHEKIENLESLKEELSFKDEQQKEEIDHLLEDNNLKVAQLAQKEKQSRLILDASVDCVFVLNSAWSVNFANVKALSLLGLEMKTIIGRSFVNIFSRYFDSELATSEEISNALLDKNTQLTMNVKDGTPIPVLVSLSKSEGIDGAMYTLFVKDLSDIKKHEDERENLFSKMIEQDAEHQAIIENLRAQLGNMKFNDDEFAEPTLVVWSKVYEIGNAEIDRQHKGIVDLINKLYSYYRTGDSNDEMLAVISSIKSKVLEHVKTEEGFFAQTDYPHTEEHKRKHLSFKEHIDVLLDELYTGGAKVSSEILHYIRRWVDEHIKGFDQDLRDYISDEKLNTATEGKGESAPPQSQPVEKVEAEQQNGEPVSLATVEWQAEFENSHSEFNNQHKTLFDLVNQLIAAYLDKKNKRQLKNIAKGLTDYAEYHFSAEEKALASSDYPDKDSHHEEHATISAVLAKVMSQINSKSQLEESALAVLIDMFCEHFAGPDRAYQTYL